jgi:hypothetical protein
MVAEAKINLLILWTMPYLLTLKLKNEAISNGKDIIKINNKTMYGWA